MSSRAHEEILFLLRNAFEDIERTKQRQWRDFYHTLIGQGALVGLALALPQRLPPWTYYALLVSVVLLTVAGLGIIKASIDTLEQQRHLVEDGYYKRLEVRELLTEPYAQPVHRTTYPDLYRGIIVGGGIISSIVIAAVACTIKG